MSDEKTLEDLRALRLDPSLERERMRYTTRSIERKQGVLLLWFCAADQESGRGPNGWKPAGSILVRISRRERLDRSNEYLAWAIAAIDFADAFDRAFALRERNHEQIDLLQLETGRCISGCYMRTSVTESVDPIDVARPGVLRTIVERVEQALRTAEVRRVDDDDGAFGYCEVYFCNECEGAIDERGRCLCPPVVASPDLPTCSTCVGTGRSPGNFGVTCPACGGSGNWEPVGPGS